MMHSADALDMLSEPRRLIPWMAQTLQSHVSAAPVFCAEAADLAGSAAVLLLVGRGAPQRPEAEEICLILNKRSLRVRQAGDLCCPGGSVAPRLDPLLARWLALPILPLGRWEYRRTWRRHRPREARWLALYLATALREAWEEMRLCPFGVRFLGPLPHQRLVMFQRVIFPLAAWVPCQRRFHPNWEVERIVHIPLRALLQSIGYVRYRLTLSGRHGPTQAGQDREMPAFQWQSKGGGDLLWGATYRIAMFFLQVVFGFIPPPLEDLPLVEGHLASGYLNAEGRQR